MVSNLGNLHFGWPLKETIALENVIESLQLAWVYVYDMRLTSFVTF